MNRLIFSLLFLSLFSVNTNLPGQNIIYELFENDIGQVNDLSRYGNPYASFASCLAFDDDVYMVSIEKIREPATLHKFSTANQQVKEIAPLGFGLVTLNEVHLLHPLSEGGLLLAGRFESTEKNEWLGICQLNTDGTILVPPIRLTGSKIDKQDKTVKAVTNNMGQTILAYYASKKSYLCEIELTRDSYDASTQITVVQHLIEKKIIEDFIVDPDDRYWLYTTSENRSIPVINVLQLNTKENKIEKVKSINLTKSSNAGRVIYHYSSNSVYAFHGSFDSSSSSDITVDRMDASSLDKMKQTLLSTKLNNPVVTGIQLKADGTFLLSGQQVNSNALNPWLANISVASTSTNFINLMPGDRKSSLSGNWRFTDLYQSKSGPYFLLGSSWKSPKNKKLYYGVVSHKYEESPELFITLGKPRFVDQISNDTLLASENAYLSIPWSLDSSYVFGERQCLKLRIVPTGSTRKIEWLGPSSFFIQPGQRNGVVHYPIKGRSSLKEGEDSVTVEVLTISNQLLASVRKSIITEPSPYPVLEVVKEQYLVNNKSFNPYEDTLRRNDTVHVTLSIQNTGKLRATNNNILLRSDFDVAVENVGNGSNFSKGFEDLEPKDEVEVTFSFMPNSFYRYEKLNIHYFITEGVQRRTKIHDSRFSLPNIREDTPQNPRPQIGAFNVISPAQADLESGSATSWETFSNRMFFKAHLDTTLDLTAANIKVYCWQKDNEQDRELVEHCGFFVRKQANLWEIQADAKLRKDEWNYSLELVDLSGQLIAKTATRLTVRSSQKKRRLLAYVIGIPYRGETSPTIKNARAVYHRLASMLDAEEQLFFDTIELDTSFIKLNEDKLFRNYTMMLSSHANSMDYDTYSLLYICGHGKLDKEALLLKTSDAKRQSDWINVGEKLLNDLVVPANNLVILDVCQSSKLKFDADIDSNLFKSPFVKSLQENYSMTLITAANEEDFFWPDSTTVLNAALITALDSFLNISNHQIIDENQDRLLSSQELWQFLEPAAKTSLEALKRDYPDQFTSKDEFKAEEHLPKISQSSYQPVNPMQKIFLSRSGFDPAKKCIGDEK